MNTWYQINLGDPILAGDMLNKIKEQFREYYPHLTHAPEAAIFIRHESDGQLHCGVKLYLTPATAKLARAVHAVPGPRPSGQDLGLFAGSDNAWALLEPDSP